MVEKLPLTLETPIQYAKGVGEVRARGFVELGIETCGDLLFYVPRDYLRFTDEAPVAAMRVGEVATVRGTILQTQLIRRPRTRLVALLKDESGSNSPEGTREEGQDKCMLTWFNPYDLVKKILPGSLVRATGKVTVFRNRLQIVQPKVEVLDGKGEEALAKKAARIEPVYPATQDLPSTVIWKVLSGMLEQLVGGVEEWFTPKHLRERNFYTRREALVKIHRPGTLKEAIVAKRTLAYHEFFLHQAAMALKRYQQRHSVPAISLRVDDVVDGRIRALLPFGLTGAQERVIGELREDLAGVRPMNRLLQGDVGSGKTVVALYAMLAACATRREAEHRRDADATGEDFAGHQAALMAPTEILAEQHFITLSRLLEGKRVKLTLLTGSVKGADRKRTLAEIAAGTAGIVVGTHALISEAVEFKSLALVVIDEQHKFGVEQRSLLRGKAGRGGGFAPHVLVMTATPIPRTLAMTAFGDLNVSVIDELPPGRKPVFTRMTPGSNREEVYEWLAKRLKGKEQAYVVVPRIDEGAADESFEPLVEVQSEGEGRETKDERRHADTAGLAGRAGAEMMSQSAHGVEAVGFGGGERYFLLRNAVGVQRELQAGVLRDFRVGLLHGRMERETRQHIMERFRQGLIDVLVATTVIEVGVDVPAATVMVIEHADRFGLSQLHQLRGRVGRGAKQSQCILLGDQTTDDGIARLSAMVRYSSGFKIAEEDLKLRGMGQMIGTAQSGRTDLHFAELLLDPVLLPLSRRDAFHMVASDPRLLSTGNAALRRELLKRFSETISLADVG